MWLNHFTELINKKFNELSDLEFKNSIIITLAIWDDHFIDNYFKDSLKKKKYQKNFKTILQNKLI